MALARLFFQRGCLAGLKGPAGRGGRGGGRGPPGARSRGRWALAPTPQPSSPPGSGRRGDRAEAEPGRRGLRTPHSRPQLGVRPPQPAGSAPGANEDSPLPLRLAGPSPAALTFPVPGSRPQLPGPRAARSFPGMSKPSSPRAVNLKRSPESKVLS